MASFNEQMPGESNTTHDQNTQDSEKPQARGNYSEKGLSVERFFTKPGIHPFEEFEWERRSAMITNEKGETVFEQHNLEIPKFWSQTATNIVASKYFRGQVGSPSRESSAKQLIGRVASTISNWGDCQGYFASQKDSEAFEAELTGILINQVASFNSPVWFNCGLEQKPQCSACFINSVKDSMASILDLAKTEGMLFKGGSGTGTNFSSLRSAKENLSGGGIASGPVSFMKGYDAFAGVIKSGGKTRRAAKMVILNIDHPDIEEFIECKAKEEKKAWALISQGYDSSFNGEAYSSVFFQNSNNSVRVTDEFMKAVLEDKEWYTRAVTNGEILGTFRARDLMRKISECAHQCGDPGLQYDTTINNWHTCLNTDRIHASNPCSEYMFLNNSACNLASINLMKFRKEDGSFDIPGFAHTAKIMVTAQEIIVDNAGYPTPAIEQNSRDYRALGLGYANLGALLMANGLPYDSDEGRNYAAAITALMQAQSYKTSAQIASNLGPFKHYSKNRESMLNVIKKHRAALEKVRPLENSHDIYGAAKEMWQETYTMGVDYGYRNAQVTVLAPTGTIGFMMDCDTTGIEPDLALVKYKKLVGGGVMKIVNQTVPLALKHLGYDSNQLIEIAKHIDVNDTIEGAPFLADNHLAIFDCAFKPRNGKRSIIYIGHLKMMAAVQPFLSGAISKTVNLPEDISVDEIQQVYIEGWKMGLKSVAVYRDGSKKVQPMSTGPKAADELKKVIPPKAVRRKLPLERHAFTHKFSIAGHEGYITVGLYEDGAPGEIFLVMAKEGSVISGMVDSFATAISLALQYGVPLKALVDKFSHMRFEPSGITNNPDIRFAKSIVDYIFRWMSLKFLPKDAHASAATMESPKKETVAKPTADETPATDQSLGFQNMIDAPPCPDCGAIMVRNGACFKCMECGATSGCS